MNESITYSEVERLRSVNDHLGPGSGPDHVGR